MDLSIVKIPVSPVTKKWITNKYSSICIGGDCIDFTKIDQRDIQLGVVKTMIVDKLEKFTKNKSDFSQECLKVKLPKHLSRHGLSEKSLYSIGFTLDRVCKNDLVMHVGLLACFPEFSKASSIRIIFEFYGITDEEYGCDIFRRYIDRYSHESMGEDFLKYRRRFTLFLKDYIHRKYQKTLTTL